MTQDTPTDRRQAQMREQDKRERIAEIESFTRPTEAAPSSQGMGDGVLERVQLRAESLARIGADQDASDLRTILAALSHPAKEPSGEAHRVVARIADAARVIGWQAGEAGCDIAGGIVSFLANHPDEINRFMADDENMMTDGTFRPVTGALTWRSASGELMDAATFAERVAARDAALSSTDNQGMV